MKSLEKNAEARKAWLRQEQGLPPDTPSGYTIHRQSDFEKSKIWRAVFVAAFVIGIVNLAEPAPQRAAPHAHAEKPTRYASGTERTTASGVEPFHNQYTTQSSSMSSLSHDGSGRLEGLLHDSFSVWRVRANSNSSSLT